MADEMEAPESTPQEEQDLEQSAPVVRREFIRYRPIGWSGKAQIAGPEGGVEAEAEVLDESIGGIGVRVNDSVPLAIGQIVRLCSGGFVRKAKLVFITGDENGARVGFEWTPDSVYEGQQGQGSS